MTRDELMAQVVGRAVLELLGRHFGNDRVGLLPDEAATVNGVTEMWVSDALGQITESESYTIELDHACVADDGTGRTGVFVRVGIWGD